MSGLQNEPGGSAPLLPGVLENPVLDMDTSKPGADRDEEKPPVSGGWKADHLPMPVQSRVAHCE